MNGYIKIHRKIVEWEWYSNKNVTRVFLHLLATCNYFPSKYRGKTIEAGQRFFGREKLATEVGLTVQQLRTSLDKLKSTNEITINNGLITIVNWECYQCNGNTHENNQQINHKNNQKNKADLPHQLGFFKEQHLRNNQEITSKLTTKITTYKESKNIKKKSNPPISPLKKKKDIFAITLPDELKLDKKIWDDFLEIRKQYPTTERAIELLLKKALRFQNEGHDVNKILLTSIERGYRDIFKPTLPSTQKNKNYAHSTPKNEDLIGYDGKDNVEIKHI